ncbi:MAG TPA: tyrosine-type recombinase/integrase [Solirubrobacteraceae bacterium]|nr:tyrosine-type recombinase/integrase [Solirubrobacteraceae bacterium]
MGLWGGRVGHAMTYASVDEIVRRTRRRVAFHFTPHQLRHTYATVARRGGVPVEIVSELLCHRSVQTTSAIYSHAAPEDLRAELERAGALERLGALT